jgi:hypothetical protein
VAKGAPKGNKNAVGNTGRPSGVDLLAMTKALLEWAEKEDSLQMIEFCADMNTYPQRIYEWRDASVEFAEALFIARAKIAKRILKKTNDGKFNSSIYHRVMSQYDGFTHDYEEDAKDREYERKKSLRAYEHKLKTQTQQASPEAQENLDRLISELKKFQDSQKQQ